jgi:GH15 family glucan-1,4-alpha-glucosidase
MATRALLDLRLSTQPDGAVVAGWRSYWRYSWPRDSSWAAVALADTGHRVDAFHILQFLQRTQLADGGWAARYWTDGPGPVRDGRPAELDAVGWVPWAVWSWVAVQRPDNRVVRRQLAGLWPMVSAAADAAVRSLSADGLPAASMDYWEDSVQVTLGTSAALLVGLHAAVALAGEFGAGGRALAWAKAAARLSAGIRAAFGHYGYHRVPYVTSGADAAITFLGPPFEPLDSALKWAALGAQRALTLKPGGGLLPGTSWRNKTVAWTAETAFFALFWASAGHRPQSAAILSWLATHRTALGVLPEKVTGSGRPVSVAPLAWTDAVVLLALLAQGHRLPVPGSPQRSCRWQCASQ